LKQSSIPFPWLRLNLSVVAVFDNLKRSKMQELKMVFQVQEKPETLKREICMSSNPKIFLLFLSRRNFGTLRSESSKLRN